MLQCTFLLQEVGRGRGVKSKKYSLHYSKSNSPRRRKGYFKGMQVEVCTLESHAWKYELFSKPAASPPLRPKFNSHISRPSPQYGIFPHQNLPPQTCLPRPSSQDLSNLRYSLHLQAPGTRSTPDLNARPQRPAPNVRPPTTEVPQPSCSPFRSPVRMGTPTWKKAKGLWIRPVSEAS